MLYVVYGKLILAGLGFTLSPMLQEIYIMAVVPMLLVNLGIYLRVLMKGSAGLKMPISKSVYIAQHKQIEIFEEAMIRGLNERKIPENVYHISRPQIIAATHHEWVHMIMDRVWGKRQNIKITNTIEALMVDQAGIHIDYTKLEFSAQKNGNIADLINLGRQIEAMEINDHEKLNKVTEEAVDAANNQAGNETEPGWFYCYGYILLGMLQQRIENSNGDYSVAGDLIKQLLSTRNGFDHQKKKEMLSFLRIGTAVVFGVGGHYFFKLLGYFGNPNIVFTDAILIHAFLLCCITAMGYTIGHELHFKRNEVKSFFGRYWKKMLLFLGIDVESDKKEIYQKLKENTEKKVSLRALWEKFYKKSNGATATPTPVLNIISPQDKANKKSLEKEGHDIRLNKMSLYNPLPLSHSI